MENTFEKLLYSLKNSIWSIPKETVTDTDVLNLACKQQVEGFLFDCFDDANRAVLASTYTQQFFKYLNVSNILNILNENGISTPVIKGISVARFYPDYIKRRSSDVDILVKESDYPKITEILKKQDFIIYKMRDEEHHLCVSHPQTGTIEFHHRLCDEIFDELWFGGSYILTDEYIDFKIDGMNFQTLGITDGFIFLFLHFLKHYILEFVTLKWVLDILFYASKNSDSINWDKVNSVIENAGYITVLNTVFGIGIEYLGFDKKIFNSVGYSIDKVNAMINDIEFCSVKENRDNLNGFFHLLNTQAQKTKDYSSYITKYNKLGILNNLFPERERIQHKYKILVKYPFVLPFVWVHRWFNGLFNMIRGKRKIKDYTFEVPRANSEMKKRLEVMKKLNILK